MADEALDIYAPVIAELKSELEETQRALDVLIAKQAKRNGVPFTASAVPAAIQHGQSAAFSNDSFFGMTVADAAKKYLGATKKTATVAAICDALIAGGWKTSAKNIPENVRTILGRHADFVRINGEFGLTEWYPGRKTGFKVRLPKDGKEFVTERIILSENEAEPSTVSSEQKPLS